MASLRLLQRIPATYIMPQVGYSNMIAKVGNTMKQNHINFDPLKLKVQITIHNRYAVIPWRNCRGLLFLGMFKGEYISCHWRNSDLSI